MKTVIFNLADKEYGIGINEVREVIRMRKIIPVPDAAGFVEGVVSLRGKVVTLVNLRAKLGLEKKELDKSTRIIITAINSHMVGMIVDSVSDVIDIPEESVTLPDEALRDAKYLSGIAKINKRLILLASVAELLSGEEKTGLDSVCARVEVRKKE